MTAPELLAASLGLSLAAAALGLVILRPLERRLADPVLRERAWAAALYVPVLPPLLIGLMLLTPAPVRTAAPADASAAAASVLMDIQGASALPAVDLAGAAVLLVLVLAVLFAVVRIVSLGLRLKRLRRLIDAAAAPGPDLGRAVEQAARRIGAPVPAVRVCQTGGEALLAGLLRPVLVLPAALAAAPDSAPTRAVCAHELAHLRRGDHRALWMEEAVLAALAINPLLRTIRDHRAAAREEACDAAALAGAPDDERRLYARSLLEAIRATTFAPTTPALTFTSARRTFVMNRLKAILAPAAPAGPRARHLAVGLAAVIAGVAGAGSLAVAAQRQPVLTVAPVEAAAAPAASPRPLAVAFPAAAAEPRPEPAFREAPAPATDAPPVYAERAEPAAQTAPRPAAISPVTWTRYPTPAYPEVAAANGLAEGRVTLDCKAERDGRMSDCAVLTEDPAGNGFGAAALRAAEVARLSQGSIDATADGARVRFTIRFRLAD